MKRALKVSDLIQKEGKTNPIEITHYRNAIQDKWISREDYMEESGEDINLINPEYRLVHLGFCNKSKLDYFVCVYEGILTFYKGFLNDGTYNEK